MLDNTDLQRSDIVVYDGKARGTKLDQYIEVLDTSDDTKVKDHEDRRTDQDDYTERVILNPVLCYMVHALDNSSTQHVSSCCSQFYTAEELKFAKDILWNIADKNVIGRSKNRIDGANRSKEEALANDITEALKKLDAAGATPRVAVDPMGLNRVPKITAAETPYLCARG